MSSAIIWAECTMAHKHSLKALHRIFQDLNGNEKIFDGATLLLPGDFRQTSVIPLSTFVNEINAYLKQSFLWRNFKTLRLTMNMQVQLQDDSLAPIFSNQLLYFGNGVVELHSATQSVKLPDNICTVVQVRHELFENVFLNILNNYLDNDWFSNRLLFWQ
ncbi:ATP-dependent DNA helicase [Trichonephila clavipes]|nr:ATP-dependent DNA helicase [Trichonephila clavipes]